MQNNELAIHAVCHASMSRNTVSEVLDVEGTLEARSEEAAERRDERREAGHEE